MKKIKVGIIGLGRIASLYEADRKAKKYYPYLTHAGAFSRNPKMELVCGADINPARCREFKKRWNVDAVYTDYQDMFDHHDLDVLSICTKPDKHWEIIQNVGAKVKVIFCEKPFTSGMSEVKKVIQWQKKNKTKITINVYREYDKTHQQTKKFIQDGGLGDLSHIHCYYGKGLRNMGSHLLTYLTGVLGIPRNIRVLGKHQFRDSEEASYDVAFTFARNIVGIVQCCDFSHYRLFEMDFIGSKGRIQIVDEGLTIRRDKVGPNDAESGAYQLCRGHHEKSTVGFALNEAANHLVRLARDNRTKPLVSAERYLRVQEIIEQIETQGAGKK